MGAQTDMRAAAGADDGDDRDDSPRYTLYRDLRGGWTLHREGATNALRRFASRREALDFVAARFRKRGARVYIIGADAGEQERHFPAGPVRAAKRRAAG